MAFDPTAKLPLNAEQFIASKLGIDAGRIHFTQWPVDRHGIIEIWAEIDGVYGACCYVQPFVLARDGLEPYLDNLARRLGFYVRQKDLAEEEDDE